MGRLAGNIAFITGGGSGIARAASVIFAREGAKVAIVDIKPELGRATEKAVKDAGGEALFIKTDVTKEESVKRAVAQTVRQFGKLDVLYNCVSSGAALRGASPAHIYTSAKGAILSLTRALAGAYAKHNVRVNAICAGRILTERILVNYGTLNKPGRIVDRQDATGRAKDYPFWIGQPEDIANIALFLASDESRMITGATIPADGGRSAY